MSKGSKRKAPFKKTPQQYRDYQNFIAESSYNPSATLPINNNMLIGSSDMNNNSDDISSTEPVKRTPVKYKAADWIKKNIFPAIMTAIIIAIGSGVINLSINFAVINEQISNLEKQMDKLDSSSVTIEILNSKLEKAKAEFESANLLTAKDLEWEIKEIKDEIEKLQLEHKQ